MQLVSTTLHCLLALHTITAGYLMQEASPSAYFTNICPMLSLQQPQNWPHIIKGPLIGKVLSVIFFAAILNGIGM